MVELKAGAGFMQGIFVEYGITVDDDVTEVAMEVLEVRQTDKYSKRN